MSIDKKIKYEEVPQLVKKTKGKKRKGYRGGFDASMGDFSPDKDFSPSGPAGGESSGGNYGSGNNVPSGPKGAPDHPTRFKVGSGYYGPVIAGGAGPTLDPTMPPEDPTMPPDLEEDLETPIEVPTKQNTLLDFFSTPKLLGILGKFLPKTDFDSAWDNLSKEKKEELLKQGITSKEEFKSAFNEGKINIYGGTAGTGYQYSPSEGRFVNIGQRGEGGQQPSGIQTITTPITPDEEEKDTITEEDVSVDGDRQAYYDDLYEQLIAAGISPSNASMIAEYRADVRFPTV